MISGSNPGLGLYYNLMFYIKYKLFAIEQIFLRTKETDYVTFSTRKW